VRKAIVAVATLLSLPACSGTLQAIDSARRGDIAGAVTSSAEAARDAEEKTRACRELAKKAVSYEEEVQIGGAVALALASKTQGVFVEDSPELKGSLSQWKGKKPAPGTGPKTELNRYVNLLGKSLAAYSARPDIEWTFAVLESPTPNAFAAPGGYVFFTTGMLKLVDNEAQLAGVLAHEIGHVAGRHQLEAYKKSKVTACATAVAANEAVSTAADSLSGEWSAALEGSEFNLDKASGNLIEKLTDKLADTLVNDGLGSAYEFEADRTAFEIMLFAGYDVDELIKLFKKLPDGGGFMTPHPANKDRIAKLEELKKNEYASFDFADLKAPKLGEQLAALPR
jgi:Zn-dependent protease with chaperone function